MKRTPLHRRAKKFPFEVIISCESLPLCPASKTRFPSNLIFNQQREKNLTESNDQILAVSKILVFNVICIMIL